MSADYDQRVARALQSLVPIPEENPGGWQRILRDAGEASTRRQLRVRRSRRFTTLPRRHRSPAVVFAAVAIAAVVAVPAIAVGTDWFFGGEGPQATGPVTTVTTGVTGGTQWQLRAFATETDGLCFVVDAAGQRGAEACGAGVRGEPVTTKSKTQNPNHWVGYVRTSVGNGSGGGGGGDVLAGPVASGVAKLEFRLGSESQQLTILPAPDALGLKIGFYAVELPASAGSGTLLARGSDGAILEELPVPSLSG